ISEVGCHYPEQDLKRVEPLVEFIVIENEIREERTDLAVEPVRCWSVLATRTPGHERLHSVVAGFAVRLEQQKVRYDVDLLKNHVWSDCAEHRRGSIVGPAISGVDRQCPQCS